MFIPVPVRKSTIKLILIYKSWYLKYLERKVLKTPHPFLFLLNLSDIVYNIVFTTDDFTILYLIRINNKFIIDTY